MPKPRVLQKYEVDESRCILCGICVDACPYDALRDGQEFELSHTSREEPMIDLMAMAQVDRETEVTYIRRERDWLQRAMDQGRFVQSDRLLTVLPTSLSRLGPGSGNGNGHGDGHAHGGDGHEHGGDAGTHAHLK
jgi:ferredoxin